MNTVKLPCGISKDGQVVYIEDAEKGLACECFCPGCKQSLVAKKGPVKEYHFAHKSKDFDCEHGLQSALHYMLKDCVQEMEYFTFKKDEKAVQYRIESVILENRINEIIPDVLVTCDGKPFIVEIYVTHAVDEEKKAKIKDIKISCVEIDFSKYPRDNLNKEALKQELSKIENFSWVYDADEDLIEEKRQLLLQFGLKRKIDIGNAILCPMNPPQKNILQNCVNLNFCKICPHCCASTEKSGYIRCGYTLPLVLNEETRKKNYLKVLVNQNKVMGTKELEIFLQKFNSAIPRAIQEQLNIFAKIKLINMQNAYASAMASAMYSTQSNSYQRRSSNTYRSYRSYHKRRR